MSETKAIYLVGAAGALEAKVADFLGAAVPDQLAQAGRALPAMLAADFAGLLRDKPGAAVKIRATVTLVLEGDAKRVWCSPVVRWTKASKRELELDGASVQLELPNQKG